MGERVNTSLRSVGYAISQLAMGGNDRLQDFVEAVRPYIEYQEWKALKARLPNITRISGECLPTLAVLQNVASHLANAHDLEIRQVCLNQFRSGFGTREIHLTVQVSWVHDDTWRSGRAEIILRFLLRRRFRWKIKLLDVLSVTHPASSLITTGFPLSIASSNLFVCTVATDRREGLDDLKESCARLGIPLHILGKGGTWRGFNYNKLKTLYWELEKNNHEHEFVLFTDAYDSLFVSDLDCIVQKFLDLSTTLLFSAEVNCFPASPGQKPDDYPACRTKYRYLNAGGFMGRTDYLLKVMREWNAADSADAGIDQQWWAHIYLSGKSKIKLDHECQIFQCLFMCEDDLEIGSSAIRNRITGSEPCVVHGNGNARLRPVADHILGRAHAMRRWKPA